MYESPHRKVATRSDHPKPDTDLFCVCLPLVSCRPRNGTLSNSQMATPKKGCLNYTTHTDALHTRVSIDPLLHSNEVTVIWKIIVQRNSSGCWANLDYAFGEFIAVQITHNTALIGHLRLRVSTSTWQHCNYRVWYCHVMTQSQPRPTITLGLSATSKVNPSCLSSVFVCIQPKHEDMEQVAE